MLSEIYFSFYVCKYSYSIVNPGYPKKWKQTNLLVMQEHRLDSWYLNWLCSFCYRCHSICMLLAGKHTQFLYFFKYLPNLSLATFSGFSQKNVEHNSKNLVCLLCYTAYCAIVLWYIIFLNTAFSIFKINSLNMSALSVMASELAKWNFVFVIFQRTYLRHGTGNGWLK